MYTHSHGIVNSAFKVEPETHNWTTLAIGDPQWPQAFYPIKPQIVEINDGNILVGSCVFNNEYNDNYVYMGDDVATEELCHVYLMFYAEGHTNVPLCDTDEHRKLEEDIPAEAKERPNEGPPLSDDYTIFVVYVVAIAAVLFLTMFIVIIYIRRTRLSRRRLMFVEFQND